jgi:hypothetical protein
MAHTFPELVIGAVLLAPFVTYLITALVVVMYYDRFCMSSALQRCSVTLLAQS